MAQVLKDETRGMIIEAAKNEFLEQGYRDSSMRRIASKSRMTAGNLYRYFKSKEDLMAVIVAPAYEAIDRVLGELTNHTVSFKNKDFDIDATQEELAEILDRLGDALVDTHKKHRIELNILMMSSGINDEIINWFTGLLCNLLSRKYGVRADSKGTTVIARAYAVALFDGLKDMLKAEDVDETGMRSLVKMYLNSFLSMTNFDAAKYISL